eukprot:jgi/Chlat1/2294/Chrsp17S02586
MDAVSAEEGGQLSVDEAFPVVDAQEVTRAAGLPDIVDGVPDSVTPHHMAVFYDFFFRYYVRRVMKMPVGQSPRVCNGDWEQQLNVLMLDDTYKVPTALFRPLLQYLARNVPEMAQKTAQFKLTRWLNGKAGMQCILKTVPSPLPPHVYVRGQGAGEHKGRDAICGIRLFEATEEILSPLLGGPVAAAKAEEFKRLFRLDTMDIPRSALAYEDDYTRKTPEERAAISARNRANAKKKRRPRSGSAAAAAAAAVAGVLPEDQQHNAWGAVSPTELASMSAATTTAMAPEPPGEPVQASIAAADALGSWDLYEEINAPYMVIQVDVPGLREGELFSLSDLKVLPTGEWRLQWRRSQENCLDRKLKFRRVINGRHVEKPTMVGGKLGCPIDTTTPIDARILDGVLTIRVRKLVGAALGWSNQPEKRKKMKLR